MTAPDPQHVGSVVTVVHEIGRQLGFDRVRIDRGQYGGLKGPWYEVGYGCGEVLVRTHDGQRWRTGEPVQTGDERSREIRALLARLRDGGIDDQPG